MGAFPIPVTIVPGGLTDAEIDALSCVPETLLPSAAAEEPVCAPPLIRAFAVAIC